MAETATRASVCMATYRGARFVAGADRIDPAPARWTDELVVVDDASPDETVDIVSKYAADPRVRLERNPDNLGYVRTFEKALRLARGDYLFLADQDDVWLEGRLDAMLEALDRTAVVLHERGGAGGPFAGTALPARRRDSQRHLANVFAVLVGYRLYTGCAMAFRRDIFDSVVPIPKFVLRVARPVAGSRR